MAAISAGSDRAARAGGTKAEARRLGSLATLSPDDLKLIASLKSIRVDSDTVVETQASGANQGWIIREGWCGRLTPGSDGSRSIAVVLLPGDCFGLGAAPWAGDRLPVRTLTPCTLLDAAPIRQVIRLKSPAHARLVEACERAGWLEQVAALNQITRLSSLAAHARVAHLIMELVVRLDQVGMAPNGSFELPVKQDVVADILGLSGVHFNRVVRQLKEEGLIDTARGFITVTDQNRLADVAAFTRDALSEGPHARVP
jgi:CRP-like cAMP-binding protein